MKHLIILLAVSVATVAAQDWLSRYDPRDWADDFGHGIVVDAAGNSYVAAECDNITLVKFSPAGETVWTRVHEVENVDTWGRMNVALDSSGNEVVAALVSVGRQNLFVLQKYTPDGTRLWLTSHEQSNSAINPGWASPVGLGVDRWGSIMVAGTARNDSTGADFVVSRFTGSGQHRWSRYFDGQRHSHDVVCGMVMPVDGRVVVTGYSTDAVRHSVATAVRYDTAGTQLWSCTHRANSNHTSYLFDVSLCADGSAVAAGKVRYLSEPSDALFVRFAANGDTTWTRTDSGLPAATVADGSGNCYVLGETDRRLVLWKYSPTGQRLWRRDIETTSIPTMPAGITLTPAGGVYVSASRWVATYGLALQVLRYDAAGQQVWKVSTDTTLNNVYEPHGLALDGAGNVYVSGRLRPPTFARYEVFAAKFRASGAVEEPGMSQAATPDAIVVRPSIVSGRCVFNIRKPEALSGIRIHDISGRAVRRLALPSGETSVTWNATDESGRPVGNGVYFAVAETPTSRTAVKFLVQR